MGRRSAACLGTSASLLPNAQPHEFVRRRLRAQLGLGSGWNTAACLRVCASVSSGFPSAEDFMHRSEKAAHEERADPP